MAETYRQPDENTARGFGVKGGINVGGGGTARDVGFGGSSSRLVGDAIPDMDKNNRAIEGSEGVHAMKQNMLRNGLEIGKQMSDAQLDAAVPGQAERAFGRAAQRSATDAAQMAFGPSNGRNVYQAAGDLMRQRAAYQFARGGDVNRHGLYKALHAMGYKTDGMNVLGNMGNTSALDGMYGRLMTRAEAKANNLLRTGVKAPSAEAPSARNIADKEIERASNAGIAKKPVANRITMSVSPSYARDGRYGANEAPWMDVDGVSVQLAGVDHNDPEAVAKAREEYIANRDWMNEGGYTWNA